MFTGLVEQTGQITSKTIDQGITRLKLTPQSELATGFGDSIAVNGCCLTVAGIEGQTLSFDVSSETLARTNLGRLATGQDVNLERAMRASDRFGGHIVSGHVDSLARLAELDKNPDGWLMRVEVPKDLGRYLVVKGSITLDGVSLTVNNLHDLEDYCLISLMLLPTTLQKTTLHSLEVGWLFNVEVDILAKYVERMQLYRS